MLAVLLLALACRLPTAQIFELRSEPVPPARSFKHIDGFYAYSEEDSPDKSVGSPFIRFQDFVAYHNGSQNPHVDEGYQGLQITVLPFKDLWKVINASKFCSDQDDVARGAAKRTETLILQQEVDVSHSVFVHKIHFKAAATAASDTDFPIAIQQTGAYSILLSNCGGFTAAQINGSITVRNAYGYLPGNEYRKLPFYQALSLVYVLLCLLWVYLSIKERSALFKIQVLIGGVLLTGCGEAAIWCATFMHWNSTGFRPMKLNILAVFASVVKLAGSHLLVLFASLGWGVWKPHLKCGTVFKAVFLGLLVIVADFIHDYLSSFRQTLPVSMTTLFLSLVPVVLLNYVFYVWVLKALADSIDMMRERKQEEKLLLFERLWNILVLALAMVTTAVLIRMYVITRSRELEWHYQWFFSDAGYQILFTSVLVATMYLWAPSKGSERYAFMKVSSNEVEAQSEQDNDNAPAAAGDAVWIEEDHNVFGEDEEAEDDTVWGATKANNKKVAPEPDLIGISVDD